MSQAIVSPEELRRFAQMLKKFNTGLAEQLTALSGQLDALSASWRDQENHRFSEEFQRNLQVVGRFIESNEQYIPFLLRKAERIDEYLQQR
ncbi:MAG: WXG100 family type VII secretion target [Planctomycetes bacterium]|nr:WXG100 family type VII secretion target [Planctomycetota bacterium]